MSKDVEPDQESTGIEITIGRSGTFQLPRQTIDRAQQTAERIKSDPKTKKYIKKDGSTVYVKDDDETTVIVHPDGIEWLPQGSISRPHIYLRRTQLAIQRKLWTEVVK